MDLTTRLASAAGNFFYMPPEAFWGHESTASDVFSAALVMFELMTGQHAFPLNVPQSATEEERLQIVRASRQQSPRRVSEVNQDLNHAWDDFFAATLERDAAKRIRVAEPRQRAALQITNQSHSSRGGTDIVMQSSQFLALTKP